MKPLKEYAPFNLGERFEDESGDVIEIILDKSFKYVGGTGYPFDVRLFGGKLVKPLDRKDPTAEALEELARLDQEAGLLEDKGEESMKYEENVWYGWNGGDCPVHPKAEVHGVEPNGVVWACVAEDVFWDSFRGAFTIIKEYREPREFWLCESTYEPFTKKPPYGNYIHVREVIEND